MRLDRHGVFFGILFAILFAIVLFGTEANAQTSASYRFLEVVDTSGRPVENATVEGGPFKGQTDKMGVIQKFPVYRGDLNTTTFTVSKRGYITYEDKGETIADPDSNFRLWFLADLYRRDRYNRIRVELLKTPATEEERKEVEIAQKRREFIWAAKRGDVATVKRLKQSGFDVNMPDPNGIPAILWAITGGAVSITKLLLDSGASLRKNKAGRKALLYYLAYCFSNDRSALNEQLVRQLLRAGADVNDADLSGGTPLLLARQIGDARIIRLLESAGAREK